MMSTIFFTDEISSSVFTPPTAEMLSFAYSTATSFILSSKADKLKYDFYGQSNVRMTFNSLPSGIIRRSLFINVKE